MNFDRYDKYVATICLDDELDDHDSELTQNDAKFFGAVLNAECK